MLEATSTSAGYPPMTQTTFLTCRAHYPGGSNRSVSVSFPVRAAFPNYLVGRHPRRHFRGLLKLHSRYGLQDCSPAYGGLLSRGSSPASYPAKPLGSYHVLPTTTWVDPPSTDDLRRWGAPLTGWPREFVVEPPASPDGSIKCVHWVNALWRGGLAQKTLISRPRH